MAYQRLDPDVKQMTTSELRHEVMRLRRAIRKHRDARRNARCWHTDLQLAAALPEGVNPGRMDGDETVLLRNCRQYIRRQQCIAHGCRKGPSRKPY